MREQVSSLRIGLPHRGTCPIDGVITFPPLDPNRVLQPHEDALILNLGINDFDVRWILVDPSNSTDLLQMSAFKQMGFPSSTLENPGWILSGFNGASTISLEDVVLPIQVRLVIQNVWFSMVKDLSHFNAIMRHTWLHDM